MLDESAGGKRNVGYKVRPAISQAEPEFIWNPERKRTPVLCDLSIHPYVYLYWHILAQTLHRCRIDLQQM